MDTRLPLRSPAQPGCPLPVRPRLRAAMVRNHPASGLAAPGRGSQCGGGQSHHTFGPMLPMGPRSPLCPEHLQGTPQQAFSAMLSCQNGERSGPRPGLGRRRPRAVTAPVGSRCPRGESAVTPAQPGAVAQQAGSPPCGGSQAGHCRAAQVSNSDSRCPLRPGPLGKSPTLMFTLPMSHETDAVPVPHGSTVRGAACRTAWTRPRGGWGVGCTRVSPPLSPGRHDPRHQTLGGPSHSLDLPVPSQPLAHTGTRTPRTHVRLRAHGGQGTARVLTPCHVTARPANPCLQVLVPALGRGGGKDGAQSVHAVVPGAHGQSSSQKPHPHSRTPAEAELRVLRGPWGRLPSVLGPRRAGIRSASPLSPCR